MKTILTILFLLIMIHEGYAQEVISSSGDFYHSESTIIAWTIGEIAIETYQSGDVGLTQGFHQGNLTVTGIWNNRNINVQISTYPNPAEDFLIVRIDNAQEQYLLSLYSSMGVHIRDQQLNSSETTLDLSGLKPAVYYLRISRTGDNKNKGTDFCISSFKIIKN